MTIDALPQAPSTSDPDNFDNEADALLGALPNMVTQINAATVAINANATAAASSASAANSSATAAASSATAAAGSATAANTSAGQASNSAMAAATSAGQAASSATLAASNAASVTASSTTAVVLGNGAKTFAVPANKQFPVGMLLQMISAGTPAARMFGSVTSYSGTTLVATSTQTEGPGGTYSDWTIAPGGATGPTGPGNAAGNATGAINELKGTAPAASATPDIWNAGGNYVPITSGTPITGFPNAPQAGARRTLQINTTSSLVNSANLAVHGGSTVLNAGDEVDVVADTVSAFRLTVRRNSGGQTYLNVREQNASGTASGTPAVSNAYTTRNLNTLVLNTINGASVSGSSIILPAGTYQIRARAPMGLTSNTGGSINHQLSLYNSTDAAYAISGTNAQTYLGSTDSWVAGQLTITGTKTFTLQHYVSVNSGVSMGLAVSSGRLETYAELEITKVG